MAVSAFFAVCSMTWLYPVKVGGLVKTVAKVHVQIIGLHVLQRLVDAFENVLAGQAAVVHAFAGGEVDLAGDDD